MGQVTIEVMRPSDSGTTMVSATVERGAWQCADEKFLEVLRAIQLPPGYHPDEDLEVADRVMRIYGGRVIDERIPAPRAAEGTVY